MSKTNLTIQLDTDVVDRARLVAARRGTSISRLVAGELTRLADDDERDEDARREASELMARAEARGGRTWKREDLYAERVDRNAS